jgi:hypothetical protein
MIGEIDTGPEFRKPSRLVLELVTYRTHWIPPMRALNEVLELAWPW